MNSNDTLPNTPHRISSRPSIHSLRGCDCKNCLGPATVKKMSTSRDRSPTRLTAESDSGRDEVDRHDREEKGIQNPASNSSPKGETGDIQLKPGFNKRLSLSLLSSNDNLNNSDSRKVKSCPSTPDNVETKIPNFNKSVTKSTQKTVRVHNVTSYNPGEHSEDDDIPAEPVTKKPLWDSLFSALRNSKTVVRALRNSKTAVGVAASVAICAILLMRVSGNTSDVYDSQTFSEDLNSLREDYKLTNESLLSFKAGLQYIKQEKSTSCIILSYGNNRVPSEDSSFIQSLSSAAAKYLRNSMEANPIILDRDELSIEDQEYLQTNYRHALEDRSVMAIKHLETLPAKTALAFHYFCDEYYPLVKNTAIILLFDTSKCDIDNTSDEHTNVLTRVERCLTQQWSQIHGDELKPLLTRVINVVIDLDKV